MCLDSPQIDSASNPWISIPPEFNLGEATTYTNVISIFLIS
jgi:hypothetical protein